MSVRFNGRRPRTMRSPPSIRSSAFSRLDTVGWETFIVLAAAEMPPASTIWIKVWSRTTRSPEGRLFIEPIRGKSTFIAMKEACLTRQLFQPYVVFVDDPLIARVLGAKYLGKVRRAGTNWNVTKIHQLFVDVRHTHDAR